MVQDMVAEVRRENDVDTAPWKPRPLQRPHGGLLRVGVSLISIVGSSSSDSENHRRPVK